LLSHVQSHLLAALAAEERLRPLLLLLLVLLTLLLLLFAPGWFGRFCWALGLWCAWQRLHVLLA
jgi:hypothetical protein